MQRRKGAGYGDVKRYRMLGHASLPAMARGGDLSDRGGALPIFQSLSY